VVPLRHIHTFGLTGGLASGKSLVSEQLRLRGVPMIDADVLARQAVAPGSEGLAEIAAQFAADVVPGGILDRKRLAAIVFAQPEERKRLEAIVHPRVQALRDARLRELEAAGEPLAGYEVPLLYEKGLQAELHPVVVVHVPEAVQVSRAMARDGSTEAEARARLAAQLPLSDKERRADYAIDNSGSIELTRTATDAVLRAICKELGVEPSRYFQAQSQESFGGGGSVNRA
jgi:dephospho-CoA kinase